MNRLVLDSGLGVTTAATIQGACNVAFVSSCRLVDGYILFDIEYK